MRQLSEETLTEWEAGTREHGVLSFDCVLELIENVRAARRERDAAAVRAGALRAAWVRRGALLARAARRIEPGIGLGVLIDVNHELLLPDPSIGGPS